MNRKTITAVAAAAILVVGTGIFFFATANKRAYLALKGDIAKSVQTLNERLSDATATGHFNKIKSGTADLAAIEKEYATALTANADAAAKTAIAQKYLDKAEETSKSVNDLVKYVASSKSDLPQLLQTVFTQYPDQAQADMEGLDNLLKPLDEAMAPINAFSAATAPVTQELRKNLTAKVTAGENLTEELQKAEALKAIETVLTKKAGK